MSVVRLYRRWAFWSTVCLASSSAFKAEDSPASSLGGIDESVDFNSSCYELEAGS